MISRPEHLISMEKFVLNLFRYMASDIGGSLFPHGLDFQQTALTLGEHFIELIPTKVMVLIR